MKIKFFSAGSCTHPEAIVIRDGRWRQANFPSLFAAIEHPKLGNILFDTGYSQRFFDETRTLPLKLYALITPVSVREEDSAIAQLHRAGIDPNSIAYIIISHFHADHIGGLRDFPNARFICSHRAYVDVKDRRNWQALRAGFLPGLLPPDFDRQAIFIEDLPIVSLPTEYAPFARGFDLLNDGTLLAVDLPGHAMGQLGLFLTAEDRSYFLIADACWLSRAYQEFIRPHPLASLIFASDRDYVDTLAKIHQLHQLNPQIEIVPTHCDRTVDRLINNY